MRLKPRSVFLGVVAFGLPIALTAGWTLGIPRQSADPWRPRGAGGLGVAPVATMSTLPKPSPEAYTRAPMRAVASVAPATSATPARTGPVGTPTRTGPTATFSPPPVPTPTGATPTPTATTDPVPTEDPTVEP